MKNTGIITALHLNDAIEMFLFDCSWAMVDTSSAVEEVEEMLSKTVTVGGGAWGTGNGGSYDGTQNGHDRKIVCFLFSRYIHLIDFWLDKAAIQRLNLLFW